jgi:serine phosphatase RsbU (regulator of sigma subunit)/ABC-type amino acid transport substrate-binding protein/anti-sigma regulatory factor (Ser/Thr protein kinase)
VLEHVARHEGWTLEYVEGAWEQCLERLQRGDIDLLVAIGYSPARAERFDFTRELVVENWGQVYVRRDTDMLSLLDLTGRRLAVVRGDIYYDTLRSVQDPLRVLPKFVEVSSYADTLRLVAQGEADAALVPRIFGAYAERSNTLTKTTIMFSPVQLRFAATKGRHQDILDALDRHLVALKADKRSVYHRSIRRWIEGVQSLIFPAWLNPLWVVGFVAGAGGLAVGLNFLLGWLVRRRTRALQASLAAQAKIASELRIARDIQMSFIPRTYPPLPGWELHGELRPAREVGGDFYDCFLLEDGRLYFALGDVSDKGVPAALFMAVTKTLLGASAVAGDSPAAIVDRVNRRTVLANDGCMFVTAFCGLLDPDTGHVTYTNAGHNPPLALRADGTVEVLEHGRAPALGIADDAVYGFHDITLRPGDALLMYTDGVTEAMDGTGAFFSDERLRAALTGNTAPSAEALAASVLGQVAAFAGDVPQSDDIAVLVVRRTGERLRLRRLADIDQLAAEVTRLGREHALADDVVFDLRLALEEAVSNTIRHGYGGDDGEVRVRFLVTREAVTVTVEDDARPFDLRTRPDPPLPPETGQGGGLGVLLIKRLMDEVDYRRTGSRNVLTLTKRIGRPACP